MPIMVSVSRIALTATRVEAFAICSVSNVSFEVMIPTEWASKKLTGKATATVGSVGLSGEFTKSFTGESSESRPLDDLIQRFDNGEFDLVAVGRALLSDPEWVAKIKEGRLSGLKGFNAEDLKRLL